MLKFRFTIWILLFSSIIYGQKKYTIEFQLNKSSDKYTSTSDSIDFNAFKIKAITKFKMQGYVGISIIDSVVELNKTVYILESEQRIKKIVLESQNKKDVTNIENTYKSINNKIISLENNGYPFAKINITNERLEDNNLFLAYEIDSGSYFNIEKIHLKSESPFDQKTILNLINLHTDEPYNESKLKKIKLLLESSKLYNLIRSPEVVFINNTAEVYIYFSKIKSSSADGYVGLLQDKNTQKLSLNGYINLKLVNALNRAELLNLNWRSSPDKTQNLIVNFEFPYLFNSPFGINSDLNLQKQDSTFIKSNANFGLSYRHDFYEIGIFNQIENSTLLNQTNNIDFRTYSKNTIGTKLKLKPFFTNQLSFYSPTLETSIGFFNIKSDSIKQSTNSGNVNYMASLTQKFKFLNYFTFTNSISHSGLKSTYNLSRNELIYFGGLKSVRGFYELELVGNNITTILNEIEYQPLPILSFKAIYDYSNFKFPNTIYTNSLGFGFGLVSDNSKLEIIVANGKVNDNPFDVNNTKIHIGFTSNF
jgi:hypothetical protein